MPQQARFRDQLVLPSRLTYLLWRALQRASTPAPDLVVRLRNGPRLLLRPPPARDLDTAYELFREDVYGYAVERTSKNAKCIVDLGANSGYSVVYFAWHFPIARFIAFEPNPTLLRPLYRNIQLSGLEARVVVHPSAACDVRKEILLTDEESESTTLTRPGARTVTVPAEDVFQALAGVRIDLLKMDIEGGEYPLLSDVRFSDLQPRSVVMEWHSTDEYPDGKRWCSQRLRDLGYDVCAYRALTDRSGMLYASHQIARSS